MYFLVLLTGFVLQLFNKKVFLWIFAGILALLAFLRYGIGIDYFAYEFLYDRLQLSAMDEYRYGLDETEVGFRVLSSFLKSIGLSYQQYLIVFAAVNIVFIVKLCKKYSFNATLSLLIFFSFYYITWTFSGIRQGVVIAVGLYYLLKYIEEKKPFKLIIVSLLLSLIHSSAIMLIVLYVLSTFNFKRNTLIVLSGISILVSLLPTGALLIKMTWLPFYYDIAPYLEGSFALNKPDFQGFARMLFLVLALVSYEVYSNQNEMSKKIINLYILSLIMYFLLQFSELTAARLTMYGKFLDIVIFANILYLYKKRINRLIYVYAIFALSFLYLFKETDAQINGSVSGDYKIAPYVNVFNSEDYNYNSRYNSLIE